MYKSDFVFVYEIKARELDSICLLAAYLKKRGYTVAFLNSWESQFNKPKAYKAKVVVISACYDNETYDYFTGHVVSFEKVVNLQWEQILSNRFYERHPDEFGDYSGVGLQTRHVCWGTKEQQWLKQNYGIKERYLKVLGYLPLDFYRSEFSCFMLSRDKQFKRYGLDPRKRTLLFVSSLTATELPSTEEHGNDEAFAKMVATEVSTRATLINWFKNIAEKHPDLQIIYRNHPAEKNNQSVQELANSHANIFMISDMPIRHWINNCDIIYNWFSTSMIEMLTSKKATYILRPTVIPHAIDAPIFENAKFITEYDDFEASALQQRMESFPMEPNELIQWYDLQECPAYERIGEWLIETLHDSTYISRPSATNMHTHPVWKKLKNVIKHTAAFKGLSKFVISHANGTSIASKLQKVNDTTLAIDKRMAAMQDQSGYIYSKYRANQATATEIDEEIKRYQEVMRESSSNSNGKQRKG